MFLKYGRTSREVDGKFDPHPDRSNDVFFQDPIRAPEVRWARGGCQGNLTTEHEDMVGARQGMFVG